MRPPSGGAVGWPPMRRACAAALALSLALAACDPDGEGRPEAETPAADPQASAGPPGDPAAGEPDPFADRGPRPDWLGEDGSFQVNGTRYEAEPVLMILDRDRLEPVGSRDGVELYQPGWAEDPRKRLFAEEEPDRWRPFVRVDPLPG
jgi:hypothetical protein